jgi:sugar transferase EpsL
VSHQRYERAKRAGDLIASGVLLFITSPLMAGLAVAVRLVMGAPVLFRQIRPGLGEKPFCLIKFRTMTKAVGRDGTLLADGDRLTPLGILMRRFSLDELPTLLNVWRGEMSLVGPRPLLMRYLPFFTPRERLRFAVRPGITGWAQINGRNSTPWSARLELDAWYVENRTFWLDVRILLKTPWRVLGTRDVIVDARSVMLNLDEERETASPPLRRGR